MSYKVETVIKHAATTVGEGPHWDDATKRLLYVDIGAGDVHRYDPVTGNNEKIHLDGNVGFVIPRSKGGIVVGLNLDVAAVDWDTKAVTKLATVPERDDNRLNDGKCDAMGRLWAGTMNLAFGTERAKNAGNFYSFGGDSVLKKQVESVTVSNGLAWTRDNKTMFYIDTPTRQVWAYDYDLSQGTIANQRVAVDFTKIPEFADRVPRPDGMTIDADDRLWVACIDRGSMSQFDAETGKLLLEVDIPGTTLITSACWGGPNLDELYVTSLRRPNFTEEQLKTEYLAGSLFRITGLGTKGLPANVFKG